MTAIVEYQYATYRGKISVTADENDDNKLVCAVAKRILSCKGLFTLPMAYESYKVVERRND